MSVYSAVAYCENTVTQLQKPKRLQWKTLNEKHVNTVRVEQLQNQGQREIYSSSASCWSGRRTVHITDNVISAGKGKNPKARSSLDNNLHTLLLLILLLFLRTPLIHILSPPFPLVLLPSIVGSTFSAKFCVHFGTLNWLVLCTVDLIRSRH